MKLLAGLSFAIFFATFAASQAADGVKARATEVTPNPAATFKPIYLVPGVRDNGGGTDVGVATLVPCTNLATTSQQIRFVVRQWSGAVLSSKTFALPGLHTFTAATHDATSYAADAELSPGILLQQGSIVVWATTNAVFCTAMTIAAAGDPPGFGVELHMVRFNPYTGSVE